MVCIYIYNVIHETICHQTYWFSQFLEFGLRDFFFQHSPGNHSWFPVKIPMWKSPVTSSDVHRPRMSWNFASRQDATLGISQGGGAELGGQAMWPASKSGNFTESLIAYQCLVYLYIPKSFSCVWFTFVILGLCDVNWS